VRNKRVRVKIKASVEGMPRREFDFRINPQQVFYRELGRRDSDRIIPWIRIVGTALVHKDLEDFPDSIGARSVEILLDAADRLLPKRRFTIALLNRGLGVRRSDEEATKMRILPWRSLISLGLRGKW